MTYLLDTCILSKLRKINADSEILKCWIDKHLETSYFISALSIGEIQTGISKLGQEEQKKKMVLEEWLLGDLIPRFEHRILGIDVHTCSLWGQLRGEALKMGRPIPVIDALIAATAMQHHLILVTENTRDFQSTGVHLLNPLI